MLGLKLGHYRISEKIGVGGMGEVYRAHDERLDRDVALKVLPAGALADEAARKRFRKEALALSKLNHPNIATVHDFDTQDGVDFLVMEYIAGVTLNEKLASGPLEEKEILQLGIQTAEGLEAGHKEGVVHRDIKTGNLRVTLEGRVKILDFGLAKVMRPESEAELTASVTETRGVTGTLPYMAPEQMRGEAVDGRTDLWALGVVLYEMATGQRPFQARLATALAADIQTKPPQPPRQLNPKISLRLEEIILKCLEKDPENRYQSAKELAVDLRRLGLPEAAPVAARPRARLQWAAAGALVVALLSLVYFAEQRFWPGKPAGRRIMLAVLPFENLTGDPEQDYFSDGLTEEMISGMGRLYPQQLGIIARTSVMRYKKTKKAIDEIGVELGVDYVLEGSVRRAVDRVRITAQLIQVKDQTHLWAENYERDLRDVLGLQTEVASRIGRSLALELLPSQQVRSASARAIDPEAHEVYFRGLSLMSRGRAGLEKSLELFQQAIQLDPTYAQAYAGQGMAYNILGFLGDSAPAEAYPKQKAAALKALGLDESLADAHYLLANVLLLYEWNWAGAEREFRRAIELNPSHASAHHAYSHYLMAMGREKESLAESRKAVELDPASATLAACLGWHCLFSRLYGEAIQQSLKALAMDANNYLARFNVGRAYEDRGKNEEAIAAFQSAVEISGGRIHALAGLAHAYAAAGKRQEAQNLLADLQERAGKTYVSAYEIAAIYAALGDKDQAFAWLAKAYQERSSWLVHIGWEPRFDSLRPDPRFQDLLRRIGLPP